MGSPSVVSEKVRACVLLFRRLFLGACSRHQCRFKVMLDHLRVPFHKETLAMPDENCDLRTPSSLSAHCLMYVFSSLWTIPSSTYRARLRCWNFTCKTSWISVEISAVAISPMSFLCAIDNPSRDVEKSSGPSLRIRSLLILNG